MPKPTYKNFELKLLSPPLQDGVGPLKGSKLIEDTQYLLNNHSQNKLEKMKSFGDFYSGKIDGKYDTYTASAVRQAKWFLGYPKAECNSVAGPIFQNLLRGTEALPLSYRWRRKTRTKPVVKTVRQKAFAKAATQIGVAESPPSSNNVLYSRWYGITGSWCAMFITWCNCQVGGKRFVRSHRYAYVPYIVADARAGANGMHLTQGPIQGDLVCFDWDNDGTADHVGFFDKWVNKQAGTFTTIEGNTSMTNQSNGGQVMRRTRNVTDVQAFVRVLEP